MYQEEIEQEQRRREMFERKVRQYKIDTFGARYHGASLAKLAFPADVIEKLVEYMKKKQNFLVITGKFGCGKTYFLASLTSWLMENFDSFRYHREGDIHGKIRDHQTSDMKGDYTKVIEHVLDDQHIILDEVAGEPWTHPRQGWLEAMVDYRYNSMLPTIFISNLLQEDFKSLWGGKIYSRLFAKENIIINNIDAPDMRELGY